MTVTLLRSLLLSSLFIFCCLQLLLLYNNKSISDYLFHITGKRKTHMRNTGSKTGSDQGVGVASKDSVKTRGFKKGKWTSTILMHKDRAKKEVARKKALFRPLITIDEKETFRRAVQELVKVCSDDITFLLTGGSLLGAYRHHDIIPWDDDVDVLVRSKDQEMFKSRLKALEPRYFFESNTDANLKLFPKDANKTRRHWSWPYLDIFFYGEDDTHIWNSRFDLKWRRFSKHIVFPLTTLPYMGMSLPVPKDYKRFLREKFSIFENKCKTNWYSHKVEDSLPYGHNVELPCVELKDKFFFAI